MFSMDSRASSSVEYFSMVTFSDVPESYSISNDVVCYFTSAQNMMPESTDYVGIFPVGWQSVDAYVCSQPVIAVAEPKSSTHSVTFPAADLPGESYEFYHFCYVSAADHRVRGVSTPFQFTSDRQNDWELLEPPLSDVTVNSGTAELEVVQQLEHVDESSQVSLSGSLEAEVQRLKQELLNKQQELEKQATEYSSSMDAMQLSLDEIRRQCSDKDAKLEQLRATLDQHEKLEDKHKTELEALKLSQASSVASQAAECEVYKLQLDNHRISIDQLKTALDTYRQKEVEWKQRETVLLNELQQLRAAGSQSAVERDEHNDTGASVTDTVTDEQQRDVTTTDHAEGGQSEETADAPVDRICPICNMTFSTSDPEELFISHVEDHVVKVCPVCTQEFLPDDVDYIVHVNMCVTSNEQEQQAQQAQQQQRPEPLDMDMIV